ncbi:MAG: hypothetical protein ABI877_01580 [Gemmatimonadaceae bacterium]
MTIATCAGLLWMPARSSAQKAPPSFAPKKELVDQKRVVPKAYLPPAGMCRIWLDEVPPAQQPAPTDCATAIKNRPAKGRVVFGDEVPLKGREKDEGKEKSRKP